MTTRKIRTAAALVAAVVVLGAALAVVSAVRDGYHLYVVRTGSMRPTVQPGDAVLDRSPAGARIGDVITMDVSGRGDFVTHRLVEVDDRGLLHTKGDANRVPDAWSLPRSQVAGIVDRTLPNLGYLVVFFRQPTGVAGVATSALALAMLWGLCFPAKRPEDDTDVREVVEDPADAEVTLEELFVPAQRAPGEVPVGSAQSETETGSPVVRTP